MIKAEKKNQAFALFIHQGISLRKITEKIDISRSTLERWCRDESWVEKRREYWFSISQRICDEQVAKYIGDQNSIVGKLSEVFRMAHFQHMAYLNGKLPKSAMRYSIRDICRLAVSIHQIGLNEAQRAGITANLGLKN